MPERVHLSGEDAMVQPIEAKAKKRARLRHQTKCKRLIQSGPVHRCGSDKLTRFKHIRCTDHLFSFLR
jgi:hypothetical protein